MIRKILSTLARKSKCVVCDIMHALEMQGLVRTRRDLQCCPQTQCEQQAVLHDHWIPQLLFRQINDIDQHKSCCCARFNIKSTLE